MNMTKTGGEGGVKKGGRTNSQNTTKGKKQKGKYRNKKEESMADKN